VGRLWGCGFVIWIDIGCWCNSKHARYFFLKMLLRSSSRFSSATAPKKKPPGLMLHLPAKISWTVDPKHWPVARAKIAGMRKICGPTALAHGLRPLPPLLLHRGDAGGRAGGWGLPPKRGSDPGRLYARIARRPKYK
jgi:hypothetical protein